MSAREQLQREAAQLPEGVIQRLLDYLHELPPSEAGAADSATRSDYFTNHWSRWYGRCENEAWDEPADLPQETRETW